MEHPLNPVSLLIAPLLSKDMQQDKIKLCVKN